MSTPPDQAIQRLVDSCIDMLNGMTQARIELGMPESEIPDSVLASLARMFNGDPK
jgi:hypothetical protein